MDAQDLARQLTGCQYGEEIPVAIERLAKAAGLVVVFGGSDDLMEFRGAIHDEVGCGRRTSVLVDATGLVPQFSGIDKDDQDALRDYFQREHAGRKIEALWGAEPGYSWTYQTDIPHATFEVREEDEPYCRGIVFALADARA